jgi:hypothetical protein
VRLPRRAPRQWPRRVMSRRSARLEFGGSEAPGRFGAGR